MSQAILDKWLPTAANVDPVRTTYGIPIRSLLGEAVDLARFVQAYWDPMVDASGTITRPGLSQAGAKLPPNIANEILELQEALQTANTNYLLTVAPLQPDVRTRAQHVLSEIIAALEWWLDDGIDDSRDKQLASLKAEYAHKSLSLDTLTSELFDYAALARQEAAGLQGLGGFDVALIDEAEQLAQKLRERPPATSAAENTRTALDVRNRIGTLLVARMAQARAAARFVFRHHPEIARQASSAFERRRRGLRKGADKNKQNDNPAPQKPQAGGQA